MKVFFFLLISTFTCLVARANVQTYVGSTPAHDVVRNFLQISLTDSIDFIRWKMEIGSGIFKLQCRYGLAKAGTPGFSNEQEVAFGYRKESMARGRWQIITEGDGRIIYRVYSDRWVRPLNLLKGDDNILFFIDDDGQLLVGNEDFSYTLNRKNEEYPRRE